MLLPRNWVHIFPCTILEPYESIRKDSCISHRRKAEEEEGCSWTTSSSISFLMVFGDLDMLIFLILYRFLFLFQSILTQRQFSWHIFQIHKQYWECFVQIIVLRASPTKARIIVGQINDSLSAWKSGMKENRLLYKLK